MKTKTYDVKESGFVAVFINAHSKEEAIKKYKIKHGWYGGNISVHSSEYNMVGKLPRRANKFKLRSIA